MGAKINDQFWFDRSEEIVKESIGNLDKGIAKLNTFIVSLWVVYTSASIFSLLFIEIKCSFFYLLIIIPHILLLLGRWYIVQGQLPISFAFDPRIPKQIEETYKKTYEIKAKSLKRANLITLLATIFIVTTLTYSFLAKNKYESEKAKIENRIKPNLTIDYLKNKQLLIFTGEVTPSICSEFCIKIVSENRDSLLFSKKTNIISSTSGVINGEFIIPNNLFGIIELEMTWREENKSIKKTITKFINHSKAILKTKKNE